MKYRITWHGDGGTDTFEADDVTWPNGTGQYLTAYTGQGDASQIVFQAAPGSYRSVERIEADPS